MTHISYQHSLFVNFYWRLLRFKLLSFCYFDSQGKGERLHIISSRPRLNGHGNSYHPFPNSKKISVRVVPFFKNRGKMPFSSPCYLGDVPRNSCQSYCLMSERKLSRLTKNQLRKSAICTCCLNKTLADIFDILR